MLFCGMKYPLGCSGSAPSQPKLRQWHNTHMELTTAYAQVKELQSFSADDALQMWNSNSLHNIKYMRTFNNIWGIFLTALVELVLPYYCKLICNTLQHHAVKISSIRFMYSKHLVPACFTGCPMVHMHPSWKHADLIPGANNACLPGFHLPI